MGRPLLVLSALAFLVACGPDAPVGPKGAAVITGLPPLRPRLQPWLRAPNEDPMVEVVPSASVGADGEVELHVTILNRGQKGLWLSSTSAPAESKGGVMPRTVTLHSLGFLVPSGCAHRPIASEPSRAYIPSGGRLRVRVFDPGFDGVPPHARSGPGDRSLAVYYSTARTGTWSKPVAWSIPGGET